MSEDDYNLIEKNLLGIATGEEKELFSRRMTDPVFRKDYEEFSEVQKAIRAHEHHRLKQLLLNEESGSSKTRSLQVWPWAIAASVSALVIISYFALRSTSNNLAEKYYTTYNSLTIDKPRGAADDYRLKTEAYDAYKNDQSRKAVTLVDSVLELAPNDEEALFIRGLANLQQEKYDLAIVDLIKVREDKNARWFLALAYVGNSENEKARGILAAISKDDKSPYLEAAANILSELK